MRILLFLLVSTLSVHSQSIDLKPTINNYRTVMGISDPSTQSVDSLIQLSIAYSYTNQDTCLIIGDRSVELAKEISDEEIYGKALLELGDTYRIFGDRIKGEELILQGRKIYEDHNNKGQLAYADNKLGTLYIDLSDYEKSLQYYVNALEIWEELKDSSNLMNIYLNIGLVYSRIGAKKKANTYNDKALEFANSLTTKESKCMCLIIRHWIINYSMKSIIIIL